MINVRQNREDFITVFNNQILEAYPQAKDLLEWLKTTDFFTAPASTKYHSAEPGGLCHHSLLVFDCLWDLLSTPTFEDMSKTYDKADIALVSLCHDLCKVNYYKQSKRNVKQTIDGREQWVEQLYYVKDEKFVFGHGEKSVFYLMRYIHSIPDDVLQAVKYHMGGINGNQVDQDSSAVFAHNKLALALHLADMTATFALEERLD